MNHHSFSIKPITKKTSIKIITVLSFFLIIFSKILNSKISLTEIRLKNYYWHNYMGLREEKKKFNREAILNSARKVFIEKGFYHTSISDIIRETGLSRSTFYLYFQNKEEIFSKLAAQLYQHLLTDLIRLNKEAKTSKNNFKKNMEQSLKSLFKTLYQHQDLLKIIIQSPIGLNEEFDKIVSKYQKIFYQTVLDILQRGKEYKIVKIDNTEIAAHIIFGAIKEIINNWNEKKISEEELEKEVEEIVKIFEHGLVNK
jgi:AcrR family transcriptional regulator